MVRRIVTSWVVTDFVVVLSSYLVSLPSWLSNDQHCPINGNNFSKVTNNNLFNSCLTSIFTIYSKHHVCVTIQNIPEMFMNDYSKWRMVVTQLIKLDHATNVSTSLNYFNIKKKNYIFLMLLISRGKEVDNVIVNSHKKRMLIIFSKLLRNFKESMWNRLCNLFKVCLFKLLAHLQNFDDLRKIRQYSCRFFIVRVMMRHFDLRILTEINFSAKFLILTKKVEFR